MKYNVKISLLNFFTRLNQTVIFIFNLENQQANYLSLNVWRVSFHRAFPNFIFNIASPLVFCGWLKISKKIYFINLTVSATSWYLGHRVFVCCCFCPHLSFRRWHFVFYKKQKKQNLIHLQHFTIPTRMPHLTILTPNPDESYFYIFLHKDYRGLHQEIQEQGANL